MALESLASAGLRLTVEIIWTINRAESTSMAAVGVKSARCYIEVPHPTSEPLCWAGKEREEI